MTLEKIHVSDIATKNGDFHSNFAYANFTGELVISGDFTLWGGVGYFDEFTPHKEYLCLFPVLMGNDTSFWFTIENRQQFFDMLHMDLPDSTIPYIPREDTRKTIENITIKIDNFTLVTLGNGGPNQANVMNIMN